MTDMSAYPKTRVQRSAASPYEGKHQRARALNNRCAHAGRRSRERKTGERRNRGPIGYFWHHDYSLDFDANLRPQQAKNGLRRAESNANINAFR